MRDLPRLLWFVWLSGVALLGLLIWTHPTSELRELAEYHRRPPMLLPIPIILHRDFSKIALFVMVTSFVLGCISLARPAYARILIPLAIGLTLFFLTLYTWTISQWMTEWMKASASNPSAL